MIEVDQAKRLLLDEAGALDTLDVPVEAALGRVLAEAIHADRDVPVGDLSTMDGFALRSADVASPGARLRLRGEVRAGQARPPVELAAGEALRIYTGALLPRGADAVVMIERTRELPDGAAIEIVDRIEPRENVRGRAEDVTQGEAVLPAGRRLRAAECAVLAAVGRRQVRVTRLPRVSVVSTGDELVPSDVIPQEHQIRNSNAPGLLAQLREMGIPGTDLGIASDEPGRLADALRLGLESDLLLVTGGVSVGRYDLVRETLVALGMRVIFHGVAVRPGKPLLAGRAGACLVVGLPGNPVSAFTAFAVFVAPALRKMEGAREPHSVELRCELGAPLARRPGRTTYQLASAREVDGRLVAHPVRTMGSGDVISLTRANAFVVLPPGSDPLAAGTEVRAVLWRELGLAEAE